MTPNDSPSSTDPSGAPCPKPTETDLAEDRESVLSELARQICFGTASLGGLYWALVSCQFLRGSLMVVVSVCIVVRCLHVPAPRWQSAGVSVICVIIVAVVQWGTSQGPSVLHAAFFPFTPFAYLGMLAFLLGGDAVRWFRLANAPSSK